MPRTPYKHSPEEGTPEAEQVPWVIHVPLGPEAADEDEDEQETTDTPTGDGD